MVFTSSCMAIILKPAQVMAAYDLLKKNPHTDTSKLAAVGYCFGGGVVLEMIRQGIDLDTAVVFHGSLATKNPASKEAGIKTWVVVLNGKLTSMLCPSRLQPSSRRWNRLEYSTS